MIAASAHTVANATRNRPDDPRVSIVIPAKNEAKNLSVVLPQLPRDHEIVLVDGKSVDGTVETAKEIRPDTRIVHQTRRGKGNALACGFEAVSGDIIVMFDADCSADPDEIPRFVNALVSGADFAKGSRFQAGGGSADITRFRSAGNRGLNMLTNRLIKSKYTDLCYGFNAFWVDVLEYLDLPATNVSSLAEEGEMWGDGFEVETVINCRIAEAGLAVTEVPSYEQLRVFGDSNLNAITDGLRVLKTIGIERRRASRRKAMRREAAKARAAEHLAAAGAKQRDIA